MENDEKLALYSSTNFWINSMSDGSSFFPMNIFSSDFTSVPFDALRLSAVSPLFQSIFNDALVSCQCSWSNENVAVIFADTDSNAIKSFISFITSGTCDFNSNTDMEQVKLLLKCLSVDIPFSIVLEDANEDDVNDFDYNNGESPPETKIKDEISESDENSHSENTSTVPIKKPMSRGRQKKPKSTNVNVEETIFCDICTVEIQGEKNSWNYMLHMSTHIGSKAFECLHCKFILRNQLDWKNHMEGETGSKKRKVCCGICGEVFVGQWKYLVHKRDEHDNEKPIQCEICNQIFVKFEVWKHHRFQHVTVVCQVCGLSITKNSLKKHMKVVHFSDPNDTKPCRICGKEFLHELNRSIHEKYSCSNDSNRICDLCGKKFKNPATLKSHIEVIHNENSRWKKMEKNHVCKICGKAFRTKTDVTKHEKRHTANGFYKCEFCDKHFPSEERLDHHNKGYHSRFKYECLVCGKQFCVISKAKRHCLQHNTAKVKSYQCELCHEWFENNDIAATHNKHFHSNEEVKPTIRHRMTEEFKELMKNVIREIQ